MFEQMLGKSEAHARLPLQQGASPLISVQHQQLLPLTCLFHQGLEKIRAVKKTSWIHSHNDEDRPVPLWDALAHGMLFIEPDVIHRDGDLYVAHNERDIHPADTLSSLYLAPLFDCLRALYPDGNDGTAHGLAPFPFVTMLPGGMHADLACQSERRLSSMPKTDPLPSYRLQVWRTRVSS